MFRTAGPRGWPVAVGVGGTESGPGSIWRSYAQAEEALHVNLRLHDGATGTAPGAFKTFGRGLAFAIEVVIDQNGEPLHVGQHREHGQLAA